MLTPTEAARTILDHVAPLPTERRALKEALDLVLAEEVRSPIDLPAADNSAMDGYAARAADVADAGRGSSVTLTVIESVPAGRFPTKTVGPGEATRIFTGAPLPAGAARTSARATSRCPRAPRSAPPSWAYSRRSPTAPRWCTDHRASRSWGPGTRSWTWIGPRRSSPARKRRRPTPTHCSG